MRECSHLSEISTIILTQNLSHIDEFEVADVYPWGVYGTCDVRIASLNRKQEVTASLRLCIQYCLLYIENWHIAQLV